MIRKIVFSALAAALLAGCVTGDYARPGDGRGDYYYGNPSTEYRHYSPYGGYAPYGYGGYDGHGYGGFGYGGYGYGRYGSPYGHRGYYQHPYYPPFYRPYYRPYHRPPVTHHPRPDGDGVPPQNRPHDGRPPWRDLDGLRRRQAADGGGNAPHREVEPVRPAMAPADSGSRMQPTMRRVERQAERGEAPSMIEQEP